MHYFDIYPHVQDEAIFKETVLTAQPVMSHEEPFEYPDRPELGVTYWDWTLRPLKNTQDKVTGLLLSSLDVTRRVRAREQIEDERKKLFSVLNMLPGYAVIKGPDYRLRSLQALREPQLDNEVPLR